MRVSSETEPSGSSAPASAGVLFGLLRSGRASTRTDLRALTGLSRTAVTVRVQALLGAGVLLSGGDRASTGGRPAGSLVLNAGAGVVLAAAIGRSRSQVGVFDLVGTELVSDSVEHAAGSPPGDVMPDVVRRLRAMLRAIDPEPWAIGISLPGAVDPVRGCSLDSPVLPGWDGVPLSDWLDGLAEVPLVIANDAHVLAQSEMLAGALRPTDALVLKASTGISVGIVADGHVLHGSRGGAGDLGHVKHEAAVGMPCRCGSTGCLEAIAGGWAVVERLRAEGLEVGHVRELAAAALRGDPRARAAARESGRVVGEVLAGVITVLDPGTVVVGGDLAPAFDQYVAGLREGVYGRTSAFAARDLMFHPATFGERAGLVGCAAVALDHVLSPGHIDLRLSSGRQSRETIDA